MGNLLNFERPLPDGGEPERPCRRCGKAMDRDAIRCRSCGARFDYEATRLSGLPWWIWLGALLATAAVVGGLLFR